MFSRINTNSNNLSFGKISNTALNYAINNARFDIIKAKQIELLAEDQNTNVPDFIVCADYNNKFKVCSPLLGNQEDKFDTFEKACDCARTYQLRLNNNGQEISKIQKACSSVNSIEKFYDEVMTRYGMKKENKTQNKTSVWSNFNLPLSSTTWNK